MVSPYFYQDIWPGLLCVFLMRQASSKRDCLSVCVCVCPSVCHTFLHICKVYTCDVIMYLLSHHLALWSCLYSNLLDSLDTFLKSILLQLWSTFRERMIWCRVISIFNKNLLICDVIFHTFLQTWNMTRGNFGNTYFSKRSWEKVSPFWKQDRATT